MRSYGFLLATFQSLKQNSHLPRELWVDTQRSGAHFRQLKPVVKDNAGWTVSQHHSALRQKGRFDDRMGHEDHRHPFFIPELVQLLVQLLASNFIERRERLVQQ